MKKIIIIILSICLLVITYYTGKQVAYNEDEELIEDLYNLSLHSDEIIDMFCDKYPDYYFDVIMESDSYIDYVDLQVKLNIGE